MGPSLLAMGCSPTKDANGSPERQAGFCVVEFLGGQNVPKMDAFDTESDPYVLAHLEDSTGRQLGQTVKTQGRRSTMDPVWNSVRDLGAVPDEEEDVLIMKLYDHDSMSSDDLIGTVQVPMRQLIAGQIVVVDVILGKDVPKVDGKTCSITLRRHSSPVNHKLTFYVIRHGESKWNEACDNKALGAMAAVDHELSLEGIEQAQRLNERWRADSGEDSIAKGFKEARGVVVSPLTRTVQTALVGLHEHPIMSGGVTLSRVIREKKNRVGFDTVGDTVGAAIAVKVEAKLGDEMADPAKAQRYMVPIDSGDATSEWWTKMNSHDNEEQLVSRLRDFLGSVHMCQQQNYIFVGHSLFFKQMMVSFCGETIKQNKKELYDKLKCSKLCNAGCAAVTVDFSSPAQPD